MFLCILFFSLCALKFSFSHITDIFVLSVLIRLLFILVKSFCAKWCVGLLVSVRRLKGSLKFPIVLRTKLFPLFVTIFFFVHYYILFCLIVIVVIFPHISPQCYYRGIYEDLLCTLSLVCSVGFWWRKSARVLKVGMFIFLRSLIVPRFIRPKFQDS